MVEVSYWIQKSCNNDQVSIVGSSQECMKTKLLYVTTSDPRPIKRCILHKYMIYDSDDLTFRGLC